MVGYARAELATLCQLAIEEYRYDEDDKRILRELYRSDPAGLQTALEADPMLEWVAYEHGITDQPPMRKS